MRVYVLLFNPGTENEGIHTLKLKDEDRNVVLMFESEEDATRYGLLLEAQDFLSPTVEEIESEEVEEFCEEANYDCVVVPEGTLAIPPEATLESTDWQEDGEVPPAEEEAEPPSEFPGTDLDAIRQRLEKLL
ncbi:MAG: DUF3110 domain-containing protein [Cyanobacteria bacterium J06638_22]|jgi:hypothetical protein